MRARQKTAASIEWSSRGSSARSHAVTLGLRATRSKPSTIWGTRSSNSASPQPKSATRQSFGRPLSHLAAKSTGRSGHPAVCSRKPGRVAANANGRVRRVGRKDAGRGEEKEREREGEDERKTSALLLQTSARAVHGDAATPARTLMIFLEEVWISLHHLKRFLPGRRVHLLIEHAEAAPGQLLAHAVQHAWALRPGLRLALGRATHAAVARASEVALLERRNVGR